MGSGRQRRKLASEERQRPFQNRRTPRTRSPSAGPSGFISIRAPRCMATMAARPKPSPEGVSVSIWQLPNVPFALTTQITDASPRLVVARVGNSGCGRRRKVTSSPFQRRGEGASWLAPVASTAIIISAKVIEASLARVLRRICSSVCGRPDRCKRVFRDSDAVGSGASVCPAC